MEHDPYVLGVLALLQILVTIRHYCEFIKPNHNLKGKHYGT